MQRFTTKDTKSTKIDRSNRLPMRDVHVFLFRLRRALSTATLPIRSPRQIVFVLLFLRALRVLRGVIICGCLALSQAAAKKRAMQRFTTKDCVEVEVKKALTMRKTKQTAVIPILIKVVADAWQMIGTDDGTLGDLNALPSKAKPIPKWTPPDEGWADVADGLRRVAETMRQNRGSTK